MRKHVATLRPKTNMSTDLYNVSRNYLELVTQTRIRKSGYDMLTVIEMSKLLKKKLNEIDNNEELDTYLSLFIAWLKKKDGSPFKVESMHNCYAALAQHLRENTAIQGLWDRYKFPKALKCLNGKMRSLQDDGFGNTDQSSALTSDELSLLCGLRGGDTYNLQYRWWIAITAQKRKKQPRWHFLSTSNVKILKHCFWNVCVKRLILKMEFGIDHLKWVKKLKKMLYQIALNTGIKLDDRKITNHSTIMILKAADIPEDGLMNFSGHRSAKVLDHIASTDDQKLNSTAMLIPNAASDDDLEEFYSYPGDLVYTNYESEIDDEDENINKTESTETVNTSNADEREEECNEPQKGLKVSKFSG
ncbi:hypothetical protein C2G38_624698 [Gigaspora rosea]|uniref:Uncharacterized protein n=1 Tax=Gigaspora rosea TaxID=44941 RepID=A0A397U7P1_9GLOM|nr:hypothetical protein C2G38_624698 [Gigaspora rosea]